MQSEKINNELAQGGSVSIIRLIESIIEYACDCSASDIHIDPGEFEIRVRLRIDGILHEICSFPKTLQAEVISRIKVMAGLRTDIHQAPQDGRVTVGLKEGIVVDVRISIAPTYHEENAVLRILHRQTKTLRLDELGIDARESKMLTDAIHRPQGMIIVTGPTGSGKTTTLYTLLSMINTSDRSLVTIEDPVEYALSGTTQMQINPRTGFTFAHGLRSILRQDPNVIMVGEMRDEETAHIAINSALTGHLVLSTLHTNDAATTLPRLIDMHIDPYLIASTVTIVVAQRLVRRICPDCRQERPVTEADLSVCAQLTTLYVGAGCAFCRESGFRGRVGIYEVMPIDHEIKEAIARRASARELRTIAIHRGMRTMLDDGWRKAIEGMTTLEEILRITHE